MATAKLKTATNSGTASPGGWQLVKLGDACEILMGQSPEGASYNNDGKGEPLLNGPTEFGPENPTATQWTTEPTRFCRAGDVLLCVRGATTGRKNIADKRYCIGRGLAAMRGKERLAETAFIWFALDHVTRKILSESAGSTFPNISGDKLERVMIPLPPLAEQRRIAGRLREQLAAVAQARAAVQAQLDAAQALPAAHLRAVFNAEATKRWPRKRLDQLCEIVASQVDPRIPEFSHLPHVSGENIESGLCRIINVRSAAEDGMISGKYLFEPGDVLYSKLRPYLRKVAIAESRGLCSADMYPLRVNPELMDARFTAWMLLGEEFSKYAIGESQRSRMPKLNREQLFGWDAPMPPLTEQRRIASNIEAEIAAACQLAEMISDRLTALDHLPAALLREAFGGNTT